MCNSPFYLSLSLSVFISASVSLSLCHCVPLCVTVSPLRVTVSLSTVLLLLLIILDDFSELKRHTMPINFRNEGGASLHPSKDRFIAGGSDLWVRVFDFKTGEQMECLKVCVVRVWVS